MCVAAIDPGVVTAENMSDPAIVERVNATGADFLIVALGAQKGQAWLMANREKLTVPVVSHLGATLNFLAGTVKRAPEAMRRLGLEWLWRIKEEPKLAPRYLSDGARSCGCSSRASCLSVSGCGGLRETGAQGQRRLA